MKLQTVLGDLVTGRAGRLLELNASRNKLTGNSFKYFITKAALLEGWDGRAGSRTCR